MPTRIEAASTTGLIKIADKASATGTSGSSQVGAVVQLNSSEKIPSQYLSTGVHLGGIGSANLLDDYEEGTWTPTPFGVGTAGSVASGTTTGVYTKVGRAVHVEFRLTAVVLSGATGAYYIGGLPFTVGGTGYNSGAVSFHTVSFDAADIQTVNASGTFLYFLNSNSGTSWTTMDQSLFGSQHYIHGSITYTV